VLVIVLLCGAHDSDITLAGEADSAFTGIVIDNEGSAVPNAVVHVAPWGTPRIVVGEEPSTSAPTAATAGLDGRFRIRTSAVPKEVTTRGHMVRIWATRGRLVSRARVVGVKHADARRLRLVLLDSTTLTLTLQDSRQDDLGGIQVQVDLIDPTGVAEDDLGSHYRVTGVTDDKGVLVARGLPMLRYGEPQVTVWQRGASPLLVTGGDCGLTQRGLAIRLRIQLPARMRISGTVEEHDGTPAAGLYVTDWNPDIGDPPANRFFRVNSDGSFTIPGVAQSARAVLVIAKDRGHCLVVGVMRLPTRRSSAAELRVATLKLARRRSVALRVVGREGSPLRGVVRIEREGFGLGGKALALGQDGSVELRDVPVGDQYRLEVYTRLPQWGEVVSKRRLPTSDRDTSVQITGAGMLIVRFISDGKDPSAVELMEPTLLWKGRETTSTSVTGSHRELRLWVGVGASGRAELSAKGVTATSGTVVIRDDEPTVIQVKVRRP